MLQLLYSCPMLKKVNPILTRDCTTLQSGRLTRFHPSAAGSARSNPLNIPYSVMQEALKDRAAQRSSCCNCKVTAFVLVLAVALTKPLLSLIPSRVYDKSIHSGAHSTSSKIWRGVSVDVDNSVQPFSAFHNLYEGNPELEALKQQVAIQRFPSALVSTTSSYTSYGIDFTDLKKLLDFWTTSFDAASSPTRLQMASFPNFRTTIQGLRIHFIHKPGVAAVGSDATCISLSSGLVVACRTGSKHTIVPLLLLHGWPGSILEFIHLIPALSARVYIDEATGSTISFSVVAPSLPGYGFSEGAEQSGMDPIAMAEIFQELMARLGYAKYHVQGGDWGGIVAACMGQIDSINGINEHITSLHLNFVTQTSPWLPVYYAWAAAISPTSAFGTPEEVSRAGPSLASFLYRLLDITGYMHQQATRPDTTAAVLAASPVALAAWHLEKLSEWADVRRHNGSAVALLGEDWIINNILMYWLPGPDVLATSGRLYKEALSSARFLLAMSSQVHTPTAVADFPREMMRSPKVFLDSRFTNITRMTTFEHGGHFAALERPDDLALDVARSIAAFLHSH